MSWGVVIMLCVVVCCLVCCFSYCNLCVLDVVSVLVKIFFFFIVCWVCL